MFRTTARPRLEQALLPLAALVLLALALSTAPASAQRAIDETHKLDKGGTLAVENLAGSITVTGWNRQEVKITGSLDDKAEKLEVTGDARELEIAVRYPDRVRNVNEGTTLVIQAPAGCRLEINGVSTTVAVDRMDGELEARTVSGKLTLRGKPAAVRAETVSGTLDLDLETDRATLSTVSGDIKVGGVRRDLSCRAVSGKLVIDAGKDLEKLTCEVISGNIRVTGQMARKAEWALSAHSGDVTVDLVGKVDARLRLKTFSGTIHDVFGKSAERTSKYAPGKELSVTEGNGEGLLTVDVFSGDVRVGKK